MTARIKTIVVATGLLATVVGVVAIAQGGGAAVQATKPDLESGTKVTISGSVGIPGVMLTGLPGNPVSDADGRYEVTVPLSWRGKVRPTKPGYEFEPSARMYDVTHLDDLLTDQDYTARAAQPAPGGPVVSEQRVLVIPTAEPNAQVVAELSEDMHIMLDILKEQLSEGPRMIQGVFMDFGDFFGQGCRQPQAMYIQGYGAIFVLETNVPIAPLQADQSAGPAGGPGPNQPPTDPVWQRAKQRLSPATTGYGGSEQVQADGPVRTIDEIKQDLIKTLKHASNIRHINGNEMIVLTVVCSGQGAGSHFRFGFSQPMVGVRGTPGAAAGGYGVTGRRSSGTSGGAGFGVSGSGGGYGGGGMYGDMMYGGGADPRMRTTGGAAQTVLTIQAMRSDIEPYAKGYLDLEQFSKSVKFFTY
jgi:uncharacterized membrane protein YgcG